MAGYAASSPRSPEDALELLRNAEFEAVVCGHNVEKPSREKLFAQIRASFPELPIIFVYTSPQEEDDDTIADASVDLSNPANLVRTLDDRIHHKAKGELKKIA